MLIDYKLGQTSIVIRVKILNSSVATGAGLTGLTSSSSGLRIATIADNESSSTAYTAGGSTIETITTLGTFATPTATKCRFKEVDATNHPGLYEIQLDNARYAVSNSKSLTVTVSGATNAAETDVVIALTQLDPYDSVRAGLTALPNASAGATNGLPLSVDSSGRVDVLKVNGTSQTARDLGANLDTTVSSRSTYAGADTSGTTTLLSRIASALTITGGKVDVNDKTGFALTAGEHTNIATDTQTGLTAQGYTTTRAGYLDTLNGLVAAVWAAGTRTLTAFSDSSGITTLLSRIGSALTITNGKVTVDGIFTTTGAVNDASPVYSSTTKEGQFTYSGSLNPTSDNDYINWWVTFTDGSNLTGRVKSITTTGGTRKITISGLAHAPTNGAGFTLVNLGGLFPNYFPNVNSSGNSTIDLTQAVPTSNTAETVGDALNAARAQGFGKWSISGTTLNLYANDGTTVVKAFTLDSSTAPTSRS